MAIVYAGAVYRNITVTKIVALSKFSTNLTHLRLSNINRWTSARQAISWSEYPLFNKRTSYYVVSIINQTPYWT